MSIKFQINKSVFYKKIITIFFVLLSFHSVFQYYVDFKILPSLYLYFFYVIAFSLPFILLYRPKSNSYRQFFLFFYFTTFLISFLFLCEDFGMVVFSMSIYFHLITAFYSERISLQQWLNIFKILAIISICSSIYILITEPIDYTVLLRRGYTWGKLFYFTTLYWAVIPFVLLSFLTKKYRFLSVAYWIFAIIVNSIFLKRFIIVDSALLLTVLVLINPNKKNLLLKLCLIILTLSMLFNNYANENINNVYLA